MAGDLTDKALAGASAGGSQPRRHRLVRRRDRGAVACRGRACRPISGARSSSPSTSIPVGRATWPRSSERHATLRIRGRRGVLTTRGWRHLRRPVEPLVEVTDDGLRLRPARRGAIAPSVDLLFTSAAKAHGERVVAVVLTGTGSDGSAGAWNVKQAGGTVVIENPETAMFPSMPARSRRRSWTRRPTSTRSARSRRHPEVDRPAGRATAATSLRRLLDRIRDRSGIDFGTYKPATIVRRLEGRMGRPGTRIVAGVRRALERDPTEYDRLVSSLLIKVTEFFRDPKVWDHLRDKVIPGLIETARRERRELRDLVGRLLVRRGGLFTGDDRRGGPARRSRPVDVRIFATDIDRAAIAFAGAASIRPERSRRAGRRSGTATSSARARATRSSSRCGRGGLRRARSERPGAVPADRPPPVPQRPDLLHAAAPAGGLETFAFSLRTGGVLVLGQSETVTAHPGRMLRITRGSGSTGGCPVISGPARVAEGGPHDPRPATRSTWRSTRPRRDAAAALDPAATAEGILLGLDVGVVVVDPHYDIVRINTAARRVLGIHGTAFEQDFIHLADALPSSAVRSAIDAALRGKTSQRGLRDRVGRRRDRRDPLHRGARPSRSRVRRRHDRRGRHRADRHHRIERERRRPHPHPRSVSRRPRRSTTGCCAPTTS